MQAVAAHGFKWTAIAKDGRFLSLGDEAEQLRKKFSNLASGHHKLPEGLGDLLEKAKRKGESVEEQEASTRAKRAKLTHRTQEEIDAGIIICKRAAVCGFCSGWMEPGLDKIKKGRVKWFHAGCIQQMGP